MGSVQPTVKSASHPALPFFQGAIFDLSATALTDPRLPTPEPATDVFSSDSPKVQQPRLWCGDGWTARVLKNEDDDGWAVAMIKDGDGNQANAASIAVNGAVVDGQVINDVEKTGDITSMIEDGDNNQANAASVSLN